MAVSVLFCSLLLFLVFALSNAQRNLVPERREVPIESAYLSTNWYFIDDPRPGVTAHDGSAAIDNITTDPNNFAHTSYEDGAFLQLTLPGRARITFLTIFNRQGHEWRLPPFIVFHTQGSMGYTESNEALMQRTDVNYEIFNTTESVYDLMMPNAFTKHIRIAVYNRVGFIEIQEVKLYQCKQIEPINAVQSSYYPPGAWSPDFAYDYDTKTFAHTNEELNTYPWIEVRFFPEFFPFHEICAVHIWNRWWHPIGSLRLPPFKVALISTYLSNTPFSGYVCDSGIDGVICSTTQYEVKQSYNVTFPPFFSADRVRVYQLNKGLMNVAEIQAFACEIGYGWVMPPMFPFEDRAANVNTNRYYNTNNYNNSTSPASAQSERSVTKNRN